MSQELDELCEELKRRAEEGYYLQEEVNLLPLSLQYSNNAGGALNYEGILHNTSGVHLQIEEVLLRWVVSKKALEQAIVSTVATGIINPAGQKDLTKVQPLRKLIEPGEHFKFLGVRIREPDVPMGTYSPRKLHVGLIVQLVDILTKNTWHAHMYIEPYNS